MGVLSGKCAIVTGGGQGIGRAVARRFAAEGAVVGVADISLEHAQRVQEEIEGAGGQAIAAAVDVCDRAAVEHMVEVVVGRFDTVDILVNCAGITRIGSFLEIDGPAWDLVFDVNCKGTLWCSQAAARVMIAQGRGGKIVNLSSQSGRRGEPLGLLYCASKAAVISLTQSIALALAPHGINVNALAPGIVDTPLWEGLDRQASLLFDQPIGEAKRLAVSTVPIGRIARPEEVAGAALFLVSPDGDYVTQQCLNVDGGNWPS